jgi:hypothetical protein
MSEFVKYEHKPVENETQLLYQVLSQGYMHVSNFREWVKHGPKSVLFGFADVVFAMPISITIAQPDGSEKRVTMIAPLLVKGLQVKALKDGNPYLGFPQVEEKLTPAERAAKLVRGEKIKYYDVVCPVTAQLRAAATQVMFDRQDVQLAIQHSVQSAEAGSAPVGEAAAVAADIEIPAQGEESPFAGDESAADGTVKV